VSFTFEIRDGADLLVPHHAISQENTDTLRKETIYDTFVGSEMIQHRKEKSISFEKHLCKMVHKTIAFEAKH
jgi:hypothetical protein